MTFIQCPGCGVATEDVKQFCGVCGTPLHGQSRATRPQVATVAGPPAETSSGKNTAIGCLGIVVIVVVLSLFFWACASCGDDDSSSSLVPTDPRDKETVQLVSESADVLAEITSQVTMGDRLGAAAAFKANIFPIYPRTDNTAMLMLSNHYIDYAENVRLYILGQATLDSVQDAQNEVSGDLLVMQP